MATFKKEARTSHLANSHHISGSRVWKNCPVRQLFQVAWFPLHASSEFTIAAANVLVSFWPEHSLSSTKLLDVLINRWPYHTNTALDTKPWFANPYWGDEFYNCMRWTLLREFATEVMNFNHRWQILAETTNFNWLGFQTELWSNLSGHAIDNDNEYIVRVHL